MKHFSEGEKARENRKREEIALDEEDGLLWRRSLQELSILKKRAVNGPMRKTDHLITHVKITPSNIHTVSNIHTLSRTHTQVL